VLAGQGTTQPQAERTNGTGTQETPTKQEAERNPKPNETPGPNKQHHHRNTNFNYFLLPVGATRTLMPVLSNAYENHSPTRQAASNGPP
jgi:hypothetical protein